MHFVVAHDTRYRYSAPVTLTPHVLRLNPRAQGVCVTERTLKVVPEPVEQLEEIDPFGNRITRVRFGAPADELRIESRLELDTLMQSTAVAELPNLPWATAGLGAGRAYPQNPVEDSVRAFAESVAQSAGYAPDDFLDALAKALHTMIDRQIRPEGAARPAAVTLATRRGACRDVTVLFLEACRSLGVPCHFVSGYQARAQIADGQRYLHAWADVLLPGIGWRGWDPTHGLRVTDGHVPLCSAPEQSATMPVEGGFYGSGVTATLDFSVHITTE